MKISRPETMSGKIRHLENICETETEVRFSHTNKKCDRQTHRRGQTYLFRKGAPRLKNGPGLYYSSKVAEQKGALIHVMHSYKTVHDYSRIFNRPADNFMYKTLVFISLHELNVMFKTLIFSSFHAKSCIDSATSLTSFTLFSQQLQYADN